VTDAQDKPVSIASAGSQNPPRATAPRRVLASRELFPGGSHELHIEHNGFIYTLRLTSKGKLILTK
jgi:hemin uptake protein HemP